jgi:hypothetical protein
LSFADRPGDAFSSLAYIDSFIISIVKCTHFFGCITFFSGDGFFILPKAYQGSLAAIKKPSLEKKAPPAGMRIVFILMYIFCVILFVLRSV